MNGGGGIPPRIAGIAEIAMTKAKEETFELPPLEDANSVQAAIAQGARGLLNGTLDEKGYAPGLLPAIGCDQCEPGEFGAGVSGVSEQRQGTAWH